jgi:hypothetical protein
MQQLSTAPATSQVLASLNESSNRRQQSIDLTISPVASRMLQRDADAMAHFMSRNTLTSPIPLLNSRAAEYPHPLPSPSAASATSPSGGNGRSTSASNKPQHRFIRSLLRPSVSANALRAGNKSDIPTLGASSRLRSTTLDHTPTGSGAESTSGSELEATVLVRSTARAPGASAAMTSSSSLGARTHVTNVNTPINGFANTRRTAQLDTSESQVIIDPRQQQILSPGLFVTPAQMLPRGGV